MHNSSSLHGIHSANILYSDFGAMLLSDSVN